MVAEAQARLDFRTAHGMRLRHSLAMPCRGVDHMDFTADGTKLLASCEFSSEMVVVDVARQRVVRVLHLPRPGMPQDVKLAPDGLTFFVADMAGGGIWLIDARTFRVRGFIHTGAGAHGLYPSRDARRLYVTNRAAATISVIELRDAHGSSRPGASRTARPDMGGVSADGTDPVALGPLSLRGLRHRHAHRPAARPHPRGIRAAWPQCLAATRPLLPRAHGDSPLAPGSTRSQRTLSGWSDSDPSRNSRPWIDS